ncbi:hypothetical protein Val02_18740 [Virgisporangium aliadipatigenens]|uniref:Uncharacterized protein n=1 Tax=Virgisporangium aliadipatigenens TaxID=741659 RepID=A0A8J3YIV4_9ACTN|nr:hypothetical protein Val02_18740 [Virgisporangium aliadipatigenens]
MSEPVQPLAAWASVARTTPYTPIAAITAVTSRYTRRRLIVNIMAAEVTGSRRQDL